MPAARLEVTAWHRNAVDVLAWVRSERGWRFRH
jgi:hypothetical protein